MKIVTKIGSLLDVTAGHIVHGCNAQGVMGSGVALAVKNMYPSVFADYRDIYDNEGLELGAAYPVCPIEGLCVWNAITQEWYGKPGRNCSYDAIETCFSDINIAVNGFDKIVKEIHIPLIGSVLGGGNWEIIREIIEQTVTCPVTLWMLPK
jgi:O-acetyl-ADP-ribose deacetylase (regulator of RNase III)